VVVRGTAVVIGGGLGGLATAIRLRHAGWRVTLLEKNAQIGGRANVIRAEGFTFDTGPTLLLMRDVLDDLFLSVGRRLEDYLELIRVHPNYLVTFGDGSTLEVSSDVDRMGSQMEGLEAGSRDAFRRYIDDAGYKYRVSRDRFVERNFNHWYQFTTPGNLYYLLTTNTLRKLDRHAQRYFRDPRLVAAFTFQTMYLGLAPADAPAVYSLLPYTELEEGIWYPRGGMYRVVEALQEVAMEMGVEIRTGTEAVGVDHQSRHIYAIRLADSSSVQADVVVSNADLPYSYQHLVPANRRGRFTNRTLRRLDYGSSAFLLYLGTDREYPELLHHNVYLTQNTADNFDAIFKRHQLPSEPSLYVAAPSRTDRSLAPAGHECIYVLVPVPSLSPSIDWSVEKHRYRDLVLDRLEKVGVRGLRQHTIFERVFTPEDFAAEYHIMNGSAFGLSHNFRQVGYLRPANKARELDNLYFVGASTAPGGGVPMVIIGSRLTAQRVEQDWSRG